MNHSRSTAVAVTTWVPTNIYPPPHSKFPSSERMQIALFSSSTPSLRCFPLAPSCRDVTTVPKSSSLFSTEERQIDIRQRAHILLPILG
ncbi:hypothetical protein CEXT_236031 [Caerostris extrusa]|uniref:Uncharacterized protein n=1 Tax=Caerostris extrusa TaxID=172846 RepID=A0AAV4S014_CAEEX|nr:hypothetical protein CEXT_236031 [Caerostris extrusa]